MDDKKYSAIIFDLGMVLILYDYKIALERLEKIERGFGVNYLNHYRTNYEIHRQFERGDISEEEFLSKVMVVFNGRLNKETFKKIYSEIFTVNENVTTLLPKLKERHRLILLSNTNSIHREYGWKNYDFLKYFEKLILSYEVRAVKPEKRIYKAVENYTNEPPNEHLFIDDVKEYAEAAIKCGWDGIQFTGYENMIKNLMMRKIL